MSVIIKLDGDAATIQIEGVEAGMNIWEIREGAVNQLLSLLTHSKNSRISLEDLLTGVSSTGHELIINIDLQAVLDHCFTSLECYQLNHTLYFTADGWAPGVWAGTEGAKLLIDDQNWEITHVELSAREVHLRLLNV